MNVTNQTIALLAKTLTVIMIDYSFPLPNLHLLNLSTVKISLFWHLAMYE